MEEYRRCGNSFCQCSRDSRNSQDNLCLESKGGVEQGEAANTESRGCIWLFLSWVFKDVWCFLVALRLNPTYQVMKALASQSHPPFKAPFLLPSLFPMCPCFSHARTLSFFNLNVPCIFVLCTVWLKYYYPPLFSTSATQLHVMQCAFEAFPAPWSQSGWLLPLWFESTYHSSILINSILTCLLCICMAFSLTVRRHRGKSFI